MEFDRIHRSFAEGISILRWRGLGRKDNCGCPHHYLRDDRPNNSHLSLLADCVEGYRSSGCRYSQSFTGT